MSLRAGLIAVANAKAAEEGKAGKSEQLYAYLTSNDFRQRVEAIVEAFATMQTDLDEEKRAIRTRWAKRQKQIERALGGATGLWGDMQGVIGQSLPAIEKLSLPAPDDDSDPGGE